MTERPRVTPRVLGAVAELVPARLRRRLDEQPNLAEGWTWSGAAEAIAVHASEEAQVSISASGGLVTSLDQVHCTCLLAPRCLHLAAVVTRLPLATDESASAAAADAEPIEDAVTTLSANQRAAARQAWLAAAALLDTGASGAGLLLVGELLRAVHSCREVGLHRAAAAGVRVAQHLRDLHAERPQFRLAALAADMDDLLSTTRALMTNDSVGSEWLGTARRAYRPVGSLRVLGLFTEAVVSAAGYAGVVTYFCDQNGTLWSVADIAPGGPERCQVAYASPVDVGDASIDHRTLGREGLHLQRATGTTDGRLGAGRGVGAVRAAGAGWTAEPLARLWAEPLQAQLDRAWAARRTGRAERRAGSDLLFLRGAVHGVRDDALLIEVSSNVVLSALAATHHTELPYRQNLRLLGSAAGLPILLVGRVVFERPRACVLLAVGAADAGLALPSAWAGRVNLGLDVLQRTNVAGAAPEPRLVTAERVSNAPDPLDPLRRRVHQVVSGGRSVLSEAAWSGLARDEAALTRVQMPTAALALRALRGAVARTPSADARRDRLARAWLVCRTYLSAATARLQRLAWS